MVHETAGSITIHRRMEIAAVGHSPYVPPPPPPPLRDNSVAGASPLIPNPIKKMAIQLKRQRRTRPRAHARHGCAVKFSLTRKWPTLAYRALDPTRSESCSRFKTLRLLRLRTARFTALVSSLVNVILVYSPYHGYPRNITSV